MSRIVTSAGQASRPSIVGAYSFLDPKYDISPAYGNNASGIAALLADVPAGGTVFVPHNTYVFTSPIQVTKPLTFVGESQYSSVLLANGCNGIELTPGIQAFVMHRMEVASAVRHTTTPNTLVGVTVAGSTGARPQYHVYEDVYLDGFSTGFDFSWLWSSSLRNARASHAKIGLIAKGLSVNNMASHLAIGCDTTAESRGIVIGDGTTATEGWIISDSLIDSAGIGIEGVGATHCKVHHCFIDHNYDIGIAVRSGGVAFGGNWDIDHNYVALSAVAGTAGIDLPNTVNNVQDRGCRVDHNEVLTYVGASCEVGIRAKGSQSKRHVISSNTILGMSTYDIDVNAGADITVALNKCFSSLSPNIRGGTVVELNTGSTA